MRWKEEQRLIIVVNFDAHASFGFELALPGDLGYQWDLHKGKIVLSDQLSESTFDLNVAEGKAEVRIDLEPLQSYILQFPL